MQMMKATTASSFPFKPMPHADRMIPGCFSGHHVRITGTSTILPACNGLVTMYAPDKEVVICDGPEERVCFIAKVVAFMGYSASMPGKEKILVLIGRTWHAIMYAAAGTYEMAERTAKMDVPSPCFGYPGPSAPKSAIIKDVRGKKKSVRFTN
jgi:hypothetical protein